MNSRPIHRGSSPSRRGMTLVEVIVAMSLLAGVLASLLGTFIQSRRVTESSVLHAAATSLVYGIIEQMKGMDYTTLIPSVDEDPLAPAGSTPPHIRIRVNQDQTYWLQCVYTTAASGLEPRAPAFTPEPTATAASVGAIDNVIGPLPLSSVSGTQSQNLTLNVWMWVDEMPDAKRDVVQVKRITLVYAYTFNDGMKVRTVRDREVFVRTRFDQ